MGTETIEKTKLSYATMHFMSRNCTLTTIGLMLTSIGILLTIFWMDLYRYLLANEMKLEPKSDSFKLWKDPPIPLKFDVYLYNWTNPRNLTEDDFEKPILQQIGPYRFTEITNKTKIRWHPKNQTISYRRRSVYHFDPEGSVGRLDDLITTVNVVALSAANRARDWNFIKQKQVSVGLNLYSQKAYITKEARELLFDGYQDDLIDMARELARYDPETFLIPYDRFGWFYGRNGSEEIGGHFNMHTGADDISQIGTVKEWNYKPATDYYADDCNVVRGSGGEFYPPDANKDTPITIFNGELCRPLDLFFSEEINVEGITAYKYSATERSVDNGICYPELDCYSSGERIPSGLMNVSACRYGAPVFISFPNYYAADPYYLNFVDGLKPLRQDHEFYIALEPLTGIPIEVAARLQANVLIRSSPNIALFQDAPYMFFPLIWFEQKVRIPEKMIAEIKIAINVPTIGYFCTSFITGFGLILLIWLILQRKHIRDDSKNVKNDVSFKKKALQTAEFSPLMKSEKPYSIISEYGEKIPNGTTICPVKLAPLAIEEIETELVNSIEKESIMQPQ